MTRTLCIGLFVLVSSFAACRASNTTQHDPTVRPDPSSGNSGEPSIATPMATVMVTATATSTATMTTPRGDAGPGSCHDDGDCSTGQRCFFRDEGCATAGKCLVSDGPRECYVAIPMCSCKRHETFFGSGGCAGSGVREPWELYACPCVADGDCRGRQRCVPKAPGLSRPGTERECRDPKP